MGRSADDMSVLDRLKLALEAEALPAGARDHANHLIRRLSSPVRIACLGRAGSGKTELINMLVGRRVVPSGVVLPTLEVVHGEAAKVLVTGADGKVTEAGVDCMEKPGLDTAAFLRIELPIEILKRISLLEVTPEGDQAEQRAAVDWAIRRTDIALWCSQTFDDSERALWGRVPDSLKDHAFLVLTKADKLGKDGTLNQRIADLQEIVAEEFHSLFVVATLHALAAIGDDGTVDQTRLKASGGSALSDEVLRHADRGRRADLDSAYLFLSRYQVRSDPKAMVETARTPSRPMGEMTPSDTTPVSEPKAAVETSTPEAEETEKLDTAIYADAVRYLRRRGAGLAEQARSMGEGNAKPLIDQCVDTVEHLVDLFSQDESGHPETDAVMDDLAEAAEVMVLMQVEDGDAPAADAATLLLQLRRDMELRLAA